MKKLEIDGELFEGGVYTDDMREFLVDDDEISCIEEAFMRGWEDAN